LEKFKSLYKIRRENEKRNMRISYQKKKINHVERVENNAVDREPIQ